MRLRMLMLVVLLVLAACGGDDGANNDAVEPTAVPTLTVEERVQFAAGSIENPLLMMVKPTDTVQKRVQLIVASTLGTRLDEVIRVAELHDDLGADDDLAALFNDALERDFAVSLNSADAEAIVTVGDLIDYVHHGLAEQASDAVFEYTRLYVDVVPVDTYGEALRGLCESDSGLVVIPWLEGITYAASQALNCGQPGLMMAVAEASADVFAPVEYVESEMTPEATPEMTAEATAESTVEATEEADPTLTPTPEPTPTEPPTETPEPEATPESTPEATFELIVIDGNLQVGEPGVIIIDAGLGSTSLAVLPGRTFCRLGYDDYYSWLLPSLLFERDNIEPGEIVDYGSLDALVAAVAAGDCAGTGLSQQTFDALTENDLIENLNVAGTTIPIPYGVLVYPVEVALGERVNFGENLPLLAEDAEASRPLRLLLGQDAFIPVEATDFAILDAFIIATGVDLAQLAN